MDMDDLPARRPAPPLELLALEDLDRLSLVELDRRLQLLQAETERTAARRARAAADRAAADNLFQPR